MAPLFKDERPPPPRSPGRLRGRGPEHSGPGNQHPLEVLGVGRLSGHCAEHSGPGNQHPLEVLGVGRLSGHCAEHSGPGNQHPLEVLGVGRLREAAAKNGPANKRRTFFLRLPLMNTVQIIQDQVISTLLMYWGLHEKGNLSYVPVCTRDR